MGNIRAASFIGFAILVLSAVPAFAPPPPPPPKFDPPGLQDLVKVSHLIGLWRKHAIDPHCSDANYPDSLNIAAADADHMVMDGQTLKVTQVKVNSHIGIDIDIPPNGFRILSDTEVEYFPLAGPSYCHYTRNAAPRAGPGETNPG